MGREPGQGMETALRSGGFQMRRTLLTILAAALLVVAVPGAVYATCTTTTIYAPDGRVIFCQTCCSAGSCTTFCF
jgi:hypothetical protein